MLRQLGYVSKSFTIDAGTGRTCRLANATPEKLRSVIGENLADLDRIFRLNAANDIGLFRLSSQTIPFASHEVNTLAWWDEFAEPLSRLKVFAKDHQIRASMHPGQYTVLSSPNPKVVGASLAELESAATLLDAIQADVTGKIILHIGGAYGDRPASLLRFEVAAKRLSEAARRRLVIENDDTVYTTEEALTLSDVTGFPVVFDWFHHTIHPSTDPDHTRLIARCFATWRPEDGIPKIHLSSQSEGGRQGHHSDDLDPKDYAAFFAVAPDVPFDLMVEAKRKDLALFKLRESLGGAGVLPSSLPDSSPGVPRSDEENEVSCDGATPPAKAKRSPPRKRTGTTPP